MANKTWFLAKRNLVDNIYKISKLDNVNTTWLDTKIIVEESGKINADIHDIKVVLNLKKAMMLLFETTEDSNVEDILDINYFKKLNALIGDGLIFDPGCFRDSEVGIGDYIPPIPSEKFALEKIYELKTCNDPLEIALEIICFGIKSQFFFDANKRTAFLFANSVLISADIGFISIGDSDLVEFHDQLSCLLSDSKNKHAFKDFLFSKTSLTSDYQRKNHDFSLGLVTDEVVS